MRKLVFIGSHLGYPMDKTPLGGGAMVGLQLLRHWPQDGSCEIVALGSGPQTPVPGFEYVRLPSGPDRDLVSLSELGYAAFCRAFERATTDWLLSRRGRFDPRETCVLVNDISEGPVLAELTAAGYPVASIWHVDVVDYFNKLYLKEVVAPESLTRLYEGSRSLGVSGAVPDVLRLVFEKQRETVVHSRRMLLPSRAMAGTVERCYGGLLAGPGAFAAKARVVPWGVWDDGLPDAPAAALAQSLRGHYQLTPKTTVLITLSRISPEKGLHLLLEALRLAEAQGRLPEQDVCLFICGEPAFMQGRAYARKVRRAAAKLAKVRVFFPGYLDPARKKAYFKLAHLFVSPSVHESYGLNVVEAMNAGLAVLASDHYGVRDILDPSFGRAVAYPSLAEAPRLLSRALADLLADPAALRKMGLRAAAAAGAMPFSRAADRVLASCFELLERETAVKAGA
ncbi:MAG: glycosyltransferase [Elusimicrobiota bacterium]